MKNHSTLALEVIRKHPRSFMWGTVLRVHDIGSYTLVEYEHRHAYKDEGVQFHVYVDGKDTRMSETTLDNALLYAIAHKHLELNTASYMAKGAGKLLGVEASP